VIITTLTWTLAAVLVVAGAEGFVFVGAKTPIALRRLSGSDHDKRLIQKI